MTLLWRKGDPLPAALERLHCIQPDPAAGRAPRDAILPQFEGLDQWIPRHIREALRTAVNDELITLERVILADGEVASPYTREHLADRWSPSSPLHRAGRAVPWTPCAYSRETENFSPASPGPECPAGCDGRLRLFTYAY